MKEKSSDIFRTFAWLRGVSKRGIWVVAALTLSEMGLCAVTLAYAWLFRRLIDAAAAGEGRVLAQTAVFFLV